MDTERNLLFGVVAFQNGAVDADRLAETCAQWVSDRTQPLADMMVDRGLITDEQRTEVEKAVSQELASHGGDPHATLAATMDGRSLAAIGEIASAGGVDVIEANAAPVPMPMQGGHVVLGSLAPEADSRERYTLTHLHAKGGMGRVWLARDGALGRQIALKELRPDQSDNSIICSRFLYEAKITAQLEHPSIVPVYELGEGAAPYYTMRFVRGRTLSEAVRAYHKKRAAGEADLVGMVDLLSAFASVCHAVAYAHSRGIIHRDLKGQNVVLGDFGEVIVLDWGLAKRVGPDQLQVQAGGTVPEGGAAAPAAPEAGTAVTCAAGLDDGFVFPEPNDDRTSAGSIPGAVSDHGPSSNGSAHHGPHTGNRAIPESGAGPEGTMQGQLLGTPAYMAPEQAQGRHDLVDKRTDIYGLGAILYEILTGRPPFIAPKTAEVIRKVCQEAPPPPRQIVPQIAPGLEAVCLKALRKEKSERYATAADLAQEVRRWLADEPVRAYAEPWSERVARWARRHRTAVAAAAALIATATIALGVSTLLVSRERNEAEAQGQQARQAVHLLTRVADIGFDEQLDPLQEEFLKNALAYYEQFTGRVSRDPAVRLEHGRAYQQMGDILRKLGRLPESETRYRQAVEMLEPLASGVGAGRDAKRALARIRTLLADLLVRRGADKDRAGPLYGQALEAQRALADSKQDPASTTEDILRLGQTLKSQADLLRLDGKFSQARTAYDQAIAELERAHADDAKQAETRNELALAIDARGWIHRERGDLRGAEDDYRRALEMLEKLVAEFPTVPRYREVLARALNSLGLIEESTGRLADAEDHLRRELELVERLAKDFPDRPEHRRELARTLTNLGNVLLAQNRTGEAEPILGRAIAVNGAIAAKSPDDVQIRLDLAKCHNNLGEILRRKGDAKAAIASFRQARAINEKLVAEFPDRPRYRSTLAVNLDNLALAMQAVDPPGAEATQRAAVVLFDKLIADHPDNVEYQLGRSRCLMNQGAVLASAGRFDQAEATYRQALARVETKDPKLQTPEAMRLKALLLNNLADVFREVKRPGAEETLRRAMGIFEELASRATAGSKDRHDLAIARFNLGDTLVDLGRLPEAEPVIAGAQADFERLVAGAPKSVDYHSQLGLLLGLQGDLLARTGKLSEARTALERAVAQQARAVDLGKNRADTRALLAKHRLALAEVGLKLNAYAEAADNALKVPQALPEADRAQAYFDAARILARIVTQAGADEKLAKADRDRLARHCIGRTVLMLREAIDTDPKLADRIKKAPEFKALESRPEYQAMMNTLVDLGP
ncbi:MAG: protein kinase domain-containing protein [Isosphaeraceae bacterium]